MQKTCIISSHELVYLNDQQQSVLCQNMVFKYCISKVHGLCSCYTSFSSPFDQSLGEDAVCFSRCLDGLLNHLMATYQQGCATRDRETDTYVTSLIHFGFSGQPYIRHLAQSWHRPNHNLDIALLLLFQTRVNHHPSPALLLIPSDARYRSSHTQSGHLNPGIGHRCRSDSQPCREDVGEGIRFEDKEVDVNG